MDHLSHLCPRRKEVKRCPAQSFDRQNPPSTSNRKPFVGWVTTKRGWGRDDELSEGFSHSVAVIEEAPILSLTYSSSGPMVLLDSGAAVSVVMSCLTPYFTSVYPSLTCAAATADGNSLSVSGQGELGPLNNVLNSDTIWHNCISVSQLFDIGITVSFTPTVGYL